MVLIILLHSTTNLSLIFKIICSHQPSTADPQSPRLYTGSFGNPSSLSSPSPSSVYSILYYLLTINNHIHNCNPKTN
ncbi:hypothetical protein DICPUDRAFT_159854 [Dictyostelium purpureum]|uniref:Uncharacterized protein n=1 Tax=Dictyostelium purpureum TaxID=5786 RepID=F1A547_DICPU|nr:uncharacterized protein DICPUDRAFT_159851 [Dictyostelium purpureum]XP_003294790.1 uncharacterized protein DICPUDRAFT_159854 [Dictyostelium purpureum]EGC28678.1 hypothetical protein DICPUDRAFT_159851 [Dictyostelium purpureum]EGC28679.1 hypothetical protein DICPUDRAFT_159854 [Dictyostelium purpureum]|eukprot:XP_003294789.1 hypothetical protein DICPUDRAFT_159851 [Dictyostelium purpureum]